MSEFVKKSVLGYKEVAGGQSDQECSHVILTKGEYEKLLSEIRQAEQEKRNTEYEAEKALKSMSQDAKYKINQAEENAKNKIDVAEQELAVAKKEIEYQKGLNETLLRISRERANADRNLKPKKEHTGYVVCSSSEKEYTYREGKKPKKVMLWETMLQSPYSVGVSVEQAKKQIIRELFEKEENGDYFIQRIGINGYYPQGFERMINDGQWGNEYKDYNIMCGERYNRNFKTGYWEIRFYHTKPLENVPKDMMSCSYA